MPSDFDELEEKIRQARHADEPTKEDLQKKADQDSSRAGMQAGVEFVSSIGAGAFIGYMLDQWLDTQPVFFLILFFVGIAAGFYNVYRVTQNLGSAVGFSQLHKEEKDAKRASQDEDDLNNGE